VGGRTARTIIPIAYIDAIVTTTVTLDRTQKHELVQLRSRLEAELGRTVSLGEAIAIGAEIAQENVEAYTEDTDGSAE